MRKTTGCIKRVPRSIQPPAIGFPRRKIFFDRPSVKGFLLQTICFFPDAQESAAYGTAMEYAGRAGFPH
jgi:hypothetical protein